jgi:hypothetical protein
MIKLYDLKEGPIEKKKKKKKTSSNRPMTHVIS